MVLIGESRGMELDVKEGQQIRMGDRIGRIAARKGARKGARKRRVSRAKKARRGGERTARNPNGPEPSKDRT